METTVLAARPTRTVQMLGADARSARPVQAEAAKPTREVVPDDEGFGFLDVLSMLNPLQYLPVVGSIYRAVTGDTIPETVRTVGSLVVSGLLGGPLGVAINAVSTALQKMVGFDPDELAHTVLASIGLVGDPEQRSRTAALEHPRPDAGSVAAPWSRAQRAAYGIAGEPALSRPQMLSAFPQDESEQVMRRHLAAAAYTRSRLAVAPPLGSTPLLDFSA